MYVYAEYVWRGVVTYDLYNMLNRVVCRTGQKIYAQCVTKTGSKRFFAATYDEMWTRMQAGPRNYSEVVKDAPCHLFFDFDEGDVHAARAQIEPFLNKLLDEFNLDYTHVLLDSSNNTKQSLHVVTICNKFLVGSPTQIPYFLCALKIKDDDIDLSTIDCTIYTRNRCFRMLGSSKFGSKRMLKGKWTKQHWVNTLVQPDVALEVFKEWAPMQVQSVRSFGNNHPPCAVRAMEWIGAKNNYQFRNSLSWTFWGHLDKPVCPFVNRIHRHNNIFFVLKLGFPVRLTCHACKKSVERALPMQDEINDFLNTVL